MKSKEIRMSFKRVTWNTEGSMVEEKWMCGAMCHGKKIEEYNVNISAGSCSPIVSDARKDEDWVILSCWFLKKDVDVKIRFINEVTRFLRDCPVDSHHIEEEGTKNVIMFIKLDKPETDNDVEKVLTQFVNYVKNKRDKILSVIKTGKLYKLVGRIWENELHEFNIKMFKTFNDAKDQAEHYGYTVRKD